MQLVQFPRFALFFLSFVAAIKSYAVNENDVSKAYNKSILPYWKSGQHLSFRGKDNARIAVHIFAKSREAGAIAILPGRADPAMLYAELVYDLRNSPYSIYLIDHRGQGNSSRLTKEHDLGYVHEFDDYVEDSARFLQNIVRARPHKKVFLIAHSMGGTVANLLLEEHPELVDAVAETSPMIHFKTGAIPECVGRILSDCMVCVGKGSSYAIGKTKWIPEKDTFEKNELTLSSARFAAYWSLYSNNPDIRTGGPSYRWVYEAFRAEDTLKKFPKKSFTVPTLVLSAGDDKVGYTKDEKIFCDSKVKNCTYKEFAGAYHHILLERDSVRTPAIKQILKFFEEH